MKKFICDDLDTAIFVRTCQMVEDMDPKMRELSDKRQRASDECMKKV